MAFSERRNPRGGTFHYKRLVEGTPGTAGNFGLMLSHTFDNFVSPRHHHNFEQIRFQLEGVCCFGRDGEMVPGTVGYFPEGVFYGPQSAAGEALVLVLQFGGPSGSGYMSEDELQTSVAELSLVGEFRAGVFYRTSGEGRPRQDAYEAAWENRHKRPMSYPAGLYPSPILTQAETLPWQSEAPGAHARSFGQFKGGTAASVLQLEAGATTSLCGPSVVFVVSGAGRLADQPIEAQASIHLSPAETLPLATDTGIELLRMQLPDIAAQAALAA
jgi:hypothetical protein